MNQSINIFHSVKLVFCYVVYAACLPAIMVLERMHLYDRVEFCLFLLYYNRPDLVALFWAQSSHETGNFKSFGYKNGNSAFGMSYLGFPKTLLVRGNNSRPYTQKGFWQTQSEGNTYTRASYYNTMQSVYDFMLCLEYRLKIPMDISMEPNVLSSGGSDRVKVVCEAWALVLKDNKYFEGPHEPYSTGLFLNYAPRVAKSGKRYFIGTLICGISTYFLLLMLAYTSLTKQSKPRRVSSYK